LITYPEIYPYKNTGVEAKWPSRQTGPHVHGLTTDSKGRVYICDLGSDAIWIAERSGTGLEVVEMMDRERGDTPRHALVSDDGESSVCSHHLAIRYDMNRTNPPTSYLH
jgi:6-phosphogluconolactonase (cycloisomerase 2 family)